MAGAGILNKMLAFPTSSQALCLAGQVEVGPTLACSRYPSEILVSSSKSTSSHRSFLFLIGAVLFQEIPF